MTDIEKLKSNESEMIRQDSDDYQLFQRIKSVFINLWRAKKSTFNRSLPFGDYFIDRHEKAALLGFGKGSSIYDSSVVIGDVQVGNNVWIGPFCILDGSANLKIGNNCSISAGVQIYTHDSVRWAVSGGKMPYEYDETVIEDHCYIGPNTIIQKGVRIGKGSIIGANSFVNQSIPANSKAYGSPVKVIPIMSSDEESK